MNCHGVLNISDLYAEGRLTPGRKARVDAHLKDCPSCAAGLKTKTPRAAETTIAAPQGLKERMKKALAAPEAANLAPRRIERISLYEESWPVLASAAICAILALLLSWIGPGVPNQQYGAGEAYAQSGRRP